MSELVTKWRRRKHVWSLHHTRATRSLGSKEALPPHCSISTAVCGERPKEKQKLISPPFLPPLTVCSIPGTAVLDSPEVPMGLYASS